MAQLTTVLPNTFLLEGAVGGPVYRTSVYDGATGKEHRNVWWNTPRHEWSVTYGGLLADVQEIIDLIQEAKGQGYSFLWSPPGYAQSSFRIATDKPQIIWRSSGVTEVSFDLIEVFGE